MDGGDEDALGLPLSFYCCIYLQHLLSVSTKLKRFYPAKFVAYLSQLALVQTQALDEWREIRKSTMEGGR